MRIVSRWLMLVGLLSSAAAAWADEERPYTEGPVVAVSYIRTKVGGFDAYMKFLDTSYKKEMDELKKAGIIVDYAVYQAFPHNPHEPDIILVDVYKNMAALDGLDDKVDPIERKLLGSTDTANKEASDRDRIREILGGQLLRELKLK